ncbi:unnamed protein product [Paramecium sonneborni]|uniref:Uncharacterized protein n=1 Tax=Paramecium sonneborni TaxID=65129 RepID=A0A8S1RFV4_9CILI|nr:unnamed protein product [Paramecium sonneborni]
MNNQYPIHHPNLNPRYIIEQKDRNPRREQRMEEEFTNDNNNPFKPIEREPIDETLKQNLLQLKQDVLSFFRKLENLKIEERMKKFKIKIDQIEIAINKNQDLDLDPFQSYFTELKELFVGQAREQQLLETVQIFNNKEYQKLQQGDLEYFLKNLKKYEIAYQECQPLMSLEQESDTLDMYLTVFNPTIQNYKEIIYYEKADTPVKKYNQERSSSKMDLYQLELLMDLLNKYYKFVALPNSQVSHVQYLEHDSRTNEQNYFKYSGCQELILFVKMNFDEGLQSYAIIIVYTNNNQKKCRQISQSKCRLYLKTISDALGCATQPPFYNPQFGFNEAVDEFLKYVSLNLDQQKVCDFLLENKDYYQKDNQNNLIIDAFEMYRLGFNNKFTI